MKSFIMLLSNIERNTYEDDQENHFFHWNDVKILYEAL